MYIGGKRGVKRGSQVLKLQWNLYWLGFDGANNRDGVYGPTTKKAIQRFQTWTGLIADGIAGRKTLGKLDAIARHYQKKVGAKADGYAGSLTHRATRNFQYKYKLRVDGICGPATRSVADGSRKAKKEVKKQPAPKPIAGPTPKKGKVAILIGHWKKDSGAVYGKLREVDLNYLVCLVNTLKRELQARGYAAEVFGGSLSGRCQAANNFTGKNSGIVISIHCNAGGGRGAEVWYTSTAGKAIASKIMNSYPTEFKKRGVKLGHYYVLRHTYRPCALVEMGFIDNSYDRNLLVQPAIQAKIARAIAKSV